jgi:hypothetical protein
MRCSKSIEPTFVYYIHRTGIDYEGKPYETFIGPYANKPSSKNVRLLSGTIVKFNIVKV